MQPFIPQALPLKELEWEPLIPLIGRANRAIALYEGVLYGVPNAELLLSPLTTQEAVLSSKIEGTQATLGEVLKFEAGEPPAQIQRQEDIQEILNYRKALREAEHALKTRPFTLNLLKRLHEILLDSVRGRDKARGRFRTIQNWIGPHGTPIERAQFVPPPPQMVTECLDNWEKHYHSDSLDPLVQLAVLHAQFEIIHPFLDGNGRLGRIVIPLFLFEKKLLSRPMFYLSGWLEARREAYVGLLRDLGRTHGAWNRWIEFFLIGIDEQARANAVTARAVMDLYGTLKHRIIGLTHSQFAVPLLDQMFARPIFQSSHLVFGASGPNRATIAGLLRILRNADIIQTVRQGSGRRAAVYGLGDLINLCEGKKVV